MENNTNHNILRNLFNRKKDEEHEKGLFGRKQISFESLSLTKKVEVFLESTNVSSEQLKNIYEKIRFIINNNQREFEEYHIHVFLNDNINIEDDKKLDLLNNFIDIRCSKLLDIENGYKFAVMCIILNKYGLSEDDEMVDLFNKIMSSYDYDKIVGLYNFILDNNVIGNMNANTVKSEMKSILEEISKNKTMKNI